ncbi:MAG: glucose-6-phosphate dehydrogenase [Syntrophaceae bacterium]|nr:glucose-6-phosphate dehydrogenase [Syntrophaceae bacterium]
MTLPSHLKPMVIVIFGASGDLTERKIVPALYNLFVDKWLSECFAVIGFARTHFTETSFRQHLRKKVDRFSLRGKTNDRDWHDFASHFSYISGHYDDSAAYTALVNHLSKLDKTWHTYANHTFYLATPPEGFEAIAKNLGKAGLSHDPQRTRIIIEKPFGRDLVSAHGLNQILSSLFQESQIYRIDHYLGKETVQNILAFRFANALFEPIWDRRYIDHIQITVAEEVGVEHRGGYYDQSGALRDMIQNHLLQILCLIAMEPPVSFNDNEIRNKKVDVLHAIRPIPKDQVHRFTVRGQYGAGCLQGLRVLGYREETGVDPDSITETFVALKLLVDNWRWQDVPFYLRTGKRLPAKVSEVSIQFRPVPHQSFPSTSVKDWQANRIVIHIQPEEGINLRFQIKQPGLIMLVRPADMRFTYREAFRKPIHEAYETLLLDAMLGDATLFMRDDQVEAAWSILVPILEVWESIVPDHFPNYEAGTWGPEEAKQLLERDGRHWITT